MGMQDIKEKLKGSMPFFIIGLLWLPVGIATGNFIFMMAGFCLIVFGLATKKSWNDNWASSKKVDCPPKLRKYLPLIVFLICFIFGAILYSLIF
jgi:hypothetical protein